MIISPTQDIHGGSRPPSHHPPQSQQQTGQQGPPTPQQVPQSPQRQQSQHHQYMGISPNEEKNKDQTYLSSGQNFLVQGHHPRNYLSEGGGFWDWGPHSNNITQESPKEHNGGISAMENFVRYATSMDNNTSIEHRSYPGTKNIIHPNQNQSMGINNISRKPSVSVANDANSTWRAPSVVHEEVKCKKEKKESMDYDDKSYAKQSINFTNYNYQHKEDKPIIQPPPKPPPINSHHMHNQHHIHHQQHLQIQHQHMNPQNQHHNTSTITSASRMMPPVITTGIQSMPSMITTGIQSTPTIITTASMVSQHQQTTPTWCNKATQEDIKPSLICSTSITTNTTSSASTYHNSNNWDMETQTNFNDRISSNDAFTTPVHLKTNNSGCVEKKDAGIATPDWPTKLEERSSCQWASTPVGNPVYSWKNDIKPAVLNNDTNDGDSKNWLLSSSPSTSSASTQVKDSKEVSKISKACATSVAIPLSISASVSNSIDETIEEVIYPRIPFGTDPRQNESFDKVDVKDGQIKKKLPSYPFYGEGGPTCLDKLPGSWCCRQGGTEAPTPEHLRDGCCQGLQTLDEVLEPSPADVKDNNKQKNGSSNSASIESSTSNSSNASNNTNNNNNDNNAAGNTQNTSTETDSPPDSANEGPNKASPMTAKEFQDHLER